MRSSWCKNWPTTPAKKRAEPYTKIVEELPQMRRETVQVVRQAVSEGRRASVLVNNRSEGNAPMTVEALADAVRPPHGGDDA